MQTADLVRIGYTQEQAAALQAMQPVERLRALSIIGNAFSDMPLFETVNEIVEGEYTLEEKWEALQKNAKAVGQPYADDADPKTEVADYIYLMHN